MKRAVYMNCDGLCPDWISEANTPTLARLMRDGRIAPDHRAVVPSVTRVSAASVATGCHPQRHGLHGNRMALVQNGRLTVHDVGQYGFAETLRAATGKTLHVPTLAERVRDRGRFAAYSNVSAGAACFLDPDRHGVVRHRAFGHADGRPAEPLQVSHDMDGDEHMTRLFIDELLPSDASVLVLWLANPDLTLHGAALGSPQHLEALRRSDACVAQVELAVAERRAAGEDILLMVGSDHGQEHVGAGIDVHDWADKAGFGADLAAGRIAFATQGTAVLVYALDAVESLLAALREAPWGNAVATGKALAELGAAHGDALIAAVDMARWDETNPFGVRGQRLAAFEGQDFSGIGCGQHGGWGPDETRPFLILLHPDLASGRITQPTSLVDLAPTILEFLGLPAEGMDGRPLLSAVELSHAFT